MVAFVLALLASCAGDFPLLSVSAYKPEAVGTTLFKPALSSLVQGGDRKLRGAKKTLRTTPSRGDMIDESSSTDSGAAGAKKGDMIDESSSTDPGAADAKKDAVMVEYVHLLPIGGEEHFEIPSMIKRVILDIGVLDTTDFVEDIRSDPSLLVLGFDANPAVLSMQKFKDARFKLFNAAVGATDGLVDFHITKHPGCSSVKEPAGDELLSGPGEEEATAWVKSDCVQKASTISVPMVRLETILKMIPESLPIDFVKTDVQGYDLDVMQSAASEISRVRKIQFEVQNVPNGSGKALYKGIPSYDKVLQWVYGQGFLNVTCSTANPTQVALQEFDCVACRYSGLCNRIA